MNVYIVWIYFSATFIDWHKHRFNTTCGLCHKRSGTCRGNSQTGYITSSVFLHVFKQLLVGFLQAQHKWIVFFTLSIEYAECATLFCHNHRRAIGSKSQCAMHLNREISSLLSSVAKSHCCNHVAFCGDTDTCTAALATLSIYFLPEMIFSSLYLLRLWIALNLSHDCLNLLKLQVNDIVHDALSHCYVTAEQVEVEVSILCKWIDYIGIEIYREQTARVVRTKWNLATWISRDGSET